MSDDARAPAGERLDRDLYVPTDLPDTRPSLLLDSAIRRIGAAFSWVWGVLVVVIVVNVTLRYLFGQGRVELEELQWHLYSFGFLVGLSYCMTYDGHVRVDIFHSRFRLRTKAWIELFGVLFFLIPFITLVLWYGVPFVMRAYEIGEVSEAPGGLPARWVVKGALVLGFGLLAVAALARLTRVTALLFGLPRPLPPGRSD